MGYNGNVATTTLVVSGILIIAANVLIFDILGNIYICIGNVIIPTDEVIFFREVGSTTNQ